MKRFLQAFRIAWQSRQWQERPDWKKDDLRQVQMFLRSTTGQKMIQWMEINWQSACERATYETKDTSLTFKAGCANGIKICLTNISLLSHEDSLSSDSQDSAQEDSVSSILRRR